MASDPISALTALRNSHDRLAAIVPPLAPEQIRSQSYDRDWTIAQVLSHLGSGAEIALLFLDAAVDDQNPPGHEALGPIWGSWNARTPDEQSADALPSDERHISRLEGLTPDQLSRVHLSLAGMEFDADGATRLRLGEHAVHTWDIAVMLDPTAQVAPDAVTLILDGLPMIALWSGKPQGQPMRVAVRTRAPEREFLLDIGERVSISPWSGGAADAELQLPAEAFVRLVYGRLDPEHTPEEITARNIELDELRRTFPGF